MESVQTADTTADVVLALRSYLSFATSTFYRKVANELYFNFFVGDKSQFQAPIWFAPAGGGIHGYDSTTHFLTNGVPSHQSILKLAKPVPIPARRAGALQSRDWN